MSTLVRFGSRNHPQQLSRKCPDQLLMWKLPDLSKQIDDRATDPQFFNQLDRRFAFTVDVAASKRNAKCARYFSRKVNGLVQSWAGERVFCNPPYSRIRPWVEKALSSGAELVVLLLPANRTEQGWWHDLIEPARDRGGRIRVEFLRGRLRFIQAGKKRIGPDERPPFGSCLVIIDGPAAP